MKGMAWCAVIVCLALAQATPSWAEDGDFDSPEPASMDYGAPEEPVPAQPEPPAFEDYPVEEAPPPPVFSPDDPGIE